MESLTDETCTSGGEWGKEGKVKVKVKVKVKEERGENERS
jgi:hypothetical protein